ncbi:hypothetical protein [Helicobacter zhangjianzhongii]|uniref:Uncharacterized protein n=1 Tax=Helicobacter zhangjianzhongii TaxID=2974574 RepID=A0ACC6FRM7_9HELI|nr:MULTISPECIES: hypothetical protein [unclassified Helicobacter]MDL0080092.1 hypothetical protein [Helicobacter sp. CPD2-1]MDL0081881.1 hypothetical protein [Helicobacter sp. XJK30-2]
MDNTPNEQNTKKWILVRKLFSLTCEPLRSSGVVIHSLLESTFLPHALESAFADLWIATTSLRKSRDDEMGR